LERLFRAQGGNTKWFVAMPKDESLENIMGKAGELEKNYDWLGAVKSYEKALGLVPKNYYLKIGGIQEKIGYAFYRAAMQAGNVNEFRNRMRQAVEGCEMAKKFYERLSEPGKTRMLRCDAMIAFMGYWITSEVTEKKRLLDECWRLTKEALKSFEESGENLEYGKTYNQLSSSASLKYSLEQDLEAGEKTVREAVERGEQAISLLSSAGDAYELAKAYVKTAIYLSLLGVFFVPDMDEKERCYQGSRDYWKKANELSEEHAFLELVNISGEERAHWSYEEMRMQYESALGRAEKTKDKYLIGNALDWLATSSFWESEGIEDPDERIEHFQESLRYAEDAKDSFSCISFVSSRGGTLWTGAPHTEYYCELAFYETNLKKRRDLLQKAVVNEASVVELAESTHYPEIIGYMHHVLSKAFVSLAQMEANPERKRRLLTKALEHRNEDVRFVGRFCRFRYWHQGVTWNYLADVKAELSDSEDDPEKRRRMLEEAVSDKERCLQLCQEEMRYYEKVGSRSHPAAFGYYQHSYGDLLNRLYGLTGNSEHQRKAIKAFEDVAESFRKLDMSSRVAECRWKIARGFEALGEHLKATESFSSAANNYTRAAQKIPQLKDFYQDYALYMQAWSDIEKARHHHERQEYDSAKEYYEKAARTHEMLKQWSYLAPNYSAWAHLENAENLSRRERSEEALQTFEQAAKLFLEAKNSIQNELNRIENSDERQMATNLVQASDPRRAYCIGRMALEEAKIFDKKGDHHSSSSKYGSAAETFEQVAQALESEQERKELKLITILSRAWRKMTQAETEASPSLYLEASQLFEDAKELSPNEKARMLTLGHSRFCKALEAGTKFADTRDVTLHATAIQSLESAANYYMKAGFQNASEHARATELLFDAYVYMDNAKKETDPERKARLYMMVEKVLQSSAGSFMKAEHLEKREQVLRLLDKVKEEREFALSLSEVLHAPSTLSTTSAFTTPNPTYENAVGLERFEHAHIQAHLTASEEATLGDEFEIRLDLVNVGKEPALLVSIEGLVPPTFKITKAPPNYNIEDHTLDVKGKRLEPQKVESIKISAKATKTGVTPLCPQITYVDELGKFHTHKPEAVQNIIFPSTGFQFKTNNAQKVFEYLTKAFVEDYMKRRLTQEKSGWRTLMQVVKDAKISKKSVYGTAPRKGSAIGELEGRGVVELRMFLEERGRGGKITKARIAYEKDMIKRYIDQQVMKKEGK